MVRGDKSPRQKAASSRRTPNRASIIIRYLQTINLESVNSSHHSWRSYSFKPRRRAPGILIGHFDYTVFDSILMHVVETSKIRVLIGNLCVPEIEPDLPSNISI
jgi:hypothetical protein